MFRYLHGNLGNESTKNTLIYVFLKSNPKVTLNTQHDIPPRQASFTPFKSSITPIKVYRFANEHLYFNGSILTYEELTPYNQKRT